MAANSSSPPPVLPVEEAVEHAAETGHVPANAAAAAAEIAAAMAVVGTSVMANRFWRSASVSAAATCSS